MSISIINFKTDAKLKLEAQKLAAELGVSLSSVLNDALRKFVRDRQITLKVYK